jgi:hypothetical protein
MSKSSEMYLDEQDRLVSDCCGASPLSDGDCDSTDLGICPDCHEFCEFINECD